MTTSVARGSGAGKFFPIGKIARAPWGILPISFPIGNYLIYYFIFDFSSAIPILISKNT
jgi:hypothetical protein